MICERGFKTTINSHSYSLSPREHIYYISPPLCISISEKSPEMEGSGELVHSLCSQGDASSLIAHDTKEMVNSNILLGQRLSIQLYFSNCDQSIPMLLLQLDVAYISKSLKTQATNFLVLDEVEKSFDVCEVKITYQRSGVQHVCLKNIIPQFHTWKNENKQNKTYTLQFHEYI